MMLNEEQMCINLARNIRYLRLTRKPPLSQNMLAQKVGITKCTISKYESAHYLPPAHVLIALAKYFGYTTDELLSDKLPFMKGSEHYNENLTSGNQAQNT